MGKSFKTVGLMTHYRSQGVLETLQSLEKLLIQRNIHIVLEEQTASFLAEKGFPVSHGKEFGHDCDLIISIGGDGSFLNAAHCAMNYDIPILGVNRGTLGFLADIQPHQLEEKLDQVLAGEFSEEKRFVFQTQVMENNQPTFVEQAINDVVLKQGNIPNMLEFEIFIDDESVCLENADGLIIATPTGSTAYALSGGGPILHPTLDALVLLPMFSHTLSSRPIVVSAHSKVSVHVTGNNQSSPTLRCDGKSETLIPPGQHFTITQSPQALRLIHPNSYNYYQSLRDKLGWGSRKKTGDV